MEQRLSSVPNLIPITIDLLIPATDPDTGTCDGITCEVPGETCKDGACVCGEKDSCMEGFFVALGPDSKGGKNLKCDPTTETCTCDGAPAGTGGENWCTPGGWKCSKNPNKYEVGDAKNRGSCYLSSDACDATGICDGTQMQYQLFLSSK